MHPCKFSCSDLLSRTDLIRHRVLLDWNFCDVLSAVRALSELRPGRRLPAPAVGPFPCFLVFAEPERGLHPDY